MNTKKAATDPLARYLREFERELKKIPGVVPEDAIADAREHLAVESTTTALREPGLGVDDYYERLRESFGSPAEVASDYAEAVAPLREVPGYAPGWRLGCTRCGGSAAAPRAGVLRFKERSRFKYALGYCRACERVTWLSPANPHR